MKMSILWFRFLLLVAGFAGLRLPLSVRSLAADDQPPMAQGALAHENPLDFSYPYHDGTRERTITDLRDPAIIREGDTYYLVFTHFPFTHHANRDPNKVDYNSSPGIRLYSSSDLQHWKFEKWLVKSSELPESCPYKHRYWAPEIRKINGRFFLIFYADNWIKDEYNGNGKMGYVAFVGVARQVTGPYEHITWLKGAGRDTSLFGDGDGKTYALMPFGDEFIQEVELSGIDRGDIQLVGERKMIVARDNRDVGKKTSPDYLEGPWMIKRNGRYVLFTAAPYRAAKDGEKAAEIPDLAPGYWVGAAVADHIWGPYKKQPQVFLGGHIAVFTGPDGQEWFSYRGESGGKSQGRLCVDPIPFNADGTVKLAAKWTLPTNAPLLTRWASEVSPTNARPEYPRPQLRRDDWQNLNGVWDYAITGKAEEKIPAKFDGIILVPYPIESALSGVMQALQPDQRLWYRRTITIPEAWNSKSPGSDGKTAKRILLHFDAVDWEATAYLNGRELGRHRGGYDTFSFDITQALRPGRVQELVVSVWDPTDTSWHLSGKQTLRPAGRGYTASSGIWQTVWLESVPLTTSIETLRAVPDLESGTLRLTITGRLGNEPLDIEAKAFDNGQEVSVATGTAGFVLWPALQENKVKFHKNTGSWFTADLFLPLKNPKLWWPDQPFLYDLTVSLKKEGAVLDTVRSYFGMRSVGKQTDPKGFTRFLLNGKPTLMAGALDQGFWPDGLHTAATDDALKYDVEIAKKAGFNIIRKHVKVEPDRFYYWCDKLGLMVLQDLPTGKEGDSITDLPTSPEASAQCELEKRALIQQRWNHPAIVAWCPFNEGWGQHDTLRYAKWIKDLDPSRLVDEASGFPWHGGGDIQDSHGGVSTPNPRQIGIVSENGGYGVATPGHDWPVEIWTHQSYDAATDGTMDAMAKQIKGDRLPKLDEKSKAWFTRQVARIYSDLWAQKDNPGMTGQFFRQLYDTESECDGLVSYDRAVWKVDPSAISAAAKEPIRQAANPAPTNAASIPAATTSQRPTNTVKTATPPAVSSPMPWADTSRLGRPFAKDPCVVRFGGRYLMYFSLPPFDPKLAPTNAPNGWSIGIAESRDLRSWAKVGELRPEQPCDRNGLCAPGALVLNRQVHLFYQTYGNGTNDAICHAVSADGLRFIRDASNPVFRPSGAWTCGRAIDAEVLPVDDRLLLWFATRDPAMKTQMIGVAGADLKSDFSRSTWKQLHNGPVLKPESSWEKKCVEAPSVTRHGGALFMFYAGAYNNEPQQIGVASSPDGIHWKRVSRQPILPNGAPGTWNSSESGHPGLFADEDGKTYLFYQGNRDQGTTWFLSAVQIGWNKQVPFVLPLTGSPLK